MLPPGHIAGGYITMYAFMYIAKPAISAQDAQVVYFLGTLFSFVPDLDMFYSFMKGGRLRHATGQINHRLFFTHTPLCWLVVGMGIFLLLGRGEQAGIFALAVTLGALSHLVLDSIQYGIRWLYPFSEKLYSMRDKGVEFHITKKGFFSHWTQMVLLYIRRFTLTFICEMVVIILALIIALQ